MATTDIRPIYSHAGFEEYASEGFGRNKHDRVVYRICDGDPKELVEFAHNVCVANGREVESWHLRIAFSHEDLDPNDPNAPEIAAGLAYDIAKELFPNSKCDVVIHNDGRGECVHAHVLIVNQDELTGKALQDTRWFRVRNVADNVCARHGYSVIGRGVSHSWQKTLESGKLTEFEKVLGNTVDDCIRRATNTDEFKQLLEERGVHIHESKKDGTVGWTYRMMDETTDKPRKRRRQAAKLCHAFTREEVERHFEDMKKSRFERFQGRDVSRYVIQDAEHEQRLTDPEDFTPVSDEPEPLEVDPFSTRMDAVVLTQHAVRKGNNNLYDEMRERLNRDGVSQFKRDMERMQQETDKAREAFHREKAKGRKVDDSNDNVLAHAATNVMRTATKNGSTSALVVALLLLMWSERERQLQRMREIMQRETEYEKRSVMWSCEKREHAAKTVLEQYQEDVRKGKALGFGAKSQEQEQVREHEQVAVTTHDVERDERELDVVVEQSAEKRQLDFTRAAEPEREQTQSVPVSEPIEREHVEEPRLKVGGGYSTDRSMY